MKKIISLAMAFAFSLSLMAQEAPATAQNADNANAPEQVPELETEGGNKITALDIVFGLGYNYRKFHAVKQYSRNVGGYYIGGGIGGGAGTGTGTGMGGGWTGSGSSAAYRDLRIQMLDRQIQNLSERMQHTQSQKLHDLLESRLIRLEEQRIHLEHGSGDQLDDYTGKRIYIGNTEFGTTECYGYELNFVIPFFKNDDIHLAAALGYQFYDLDSKTTSATYSSSFEFQMHTYDVGLKLTYELFDSFDLVATLGPSFNFIDMESRSFGYSDSSSRLKMGIFGAVGAQYWIRPWLGVCVEVRYDKVFSDAVTRYAEMTLDTWNTDVKLVFMF